MRGFAGGKRTQPILAMAAAVTVGMLASVSARAGESAELQLGGFLDPGHESRDPAGNSVTATPGFGRIEIGQDGSAIRYERFAPSAVGLPLGTSRIGDFVLPDGAAGASPALRSPRLPTEIYSSAEDTAVSYFTPRFSGLQFGATYTSPWPGATEGTSLRAQARQDPVPRRDVALGVSYLESIEGIDVTLSGGYESASTPAVPSLGEALAGKDEGLERYSVGTSIGFSGLKLGGFYAKEVGEGPVSVYSWDAGVSYAVGPWTVGVDYLRSAFIDASRSGAEEEEELQTVQAGLSYSVGPGIVASVNIMHSSLEDREGKGSSGTLGILGFSYNF